MPIETLGNIYEQFLGKTIRLTKSHQAKVEDKRIIGTFLLLTLKVDQF